MEAKQQTESQEAYVKILENELNYLRREAIGDSLTEEEKAARDRNRAAKEAWLLQNEIENKTEYIRIYKQRAGIK